MATTTNAKHSKLDHVVCGYMFILLHPKKLMRRTKAINPGLTIVHPDPDQPRKSNERISVEYVAFNKMATRA